MGFGAPAGKVSVDFGGDGSSGGVRFTLHTVIIAYRDGAIV
jgi:hypothetical protein